ncbi:MAG TPA: ABC transporter ATP-binding protein [Candidatus Mailhella merdigallinarum]|uniref:ABC transporter ATP-binding protein n=1 Tax=Candidatus Mailhella merdigallinarum TaxID=2838658 RepID=A0A9D2HCK2_9BACT|nr:ABC transporter ATP-binding protein [Desulfovibrionaceae bacterium]PWM67658.1 MAG: ABC transporter ATP-binding protein [Desulfovibrionaceae bacterium]HJA08638.1 ABC transporter ATP-binding protein [Candidatus Mailhella merdigallinarum]
MSEPVLKVRSLSRNFGGLRALNDVDLDIMPGEIVALIGPNGAGKTTFFNCVTGIYVPTEGEVTACRPGGQPVRLNGMKPFRITELGLARTFQNIRLFPSMTVLENVMVGRHCRTRSGILGAIARDPATRQEEQESVDRAYTLLQDLHLAEHWNEEACNLPYGAQRRLEIARALATDPFLLLLDEPAAGMNPQETLELKNLVLELRERFHLAVLLIEHDMGMVMSLSDRVYVMEYGSRIAAGTPEQVSSNPEVIRAYLGEADHA